MNPLVYATGVLLASGLASMSGWCSAQERLITVSGTGQVQVAPDSLVTRLDVSGSGETARAAVEDYRKRRQQIEDKLNPMDFPGTTVGFSGLAIGKSQSPMQQMMFGDGGAEPNPAGSFSVGAELSIRLKLGAEGISESKIDLLIQIIDSAMDLKATPLNSGLENFNPLEGGGSMVKVESSEVERAVVEARRLALENAGEKAAELAALGGLEVVGVHAIREQTSPDAASTEGPLGLAWTQIMGLSGVGENPHLAEKIRVAAVLEVDFSVRPAAGR